ncbi:hypothetical protein [Planktotalea sp.]|uniref:hypothetical protein n=1 Tax=Planktotalea sp. TaxID=2029877 RepID=UPI003D6BE5C3
MLKLFKFFKTDKGEAEILTMRARYTMALDEMNAVLATLDEMPVLTIDAAARRIDMTAPEQFSDEALALPAPEVEETSQEIAETSDQTEDETTAESDEKSAA